VKEGKEEDKKEANPVEQKRKINKNTEKNRTTQLEGEANLPRLAVGAPDARRVRSSVDRRCSHKPLPVSRLRRGIVRGAGGRGAGGRGAGGRGRFGAAGSVGRGAAAAVVGVEVHLLYLEL